jgi:transcriptional regulator with XRE-family HTH domain
VNQRTPVRSAQALGQALARLRYDNDLTQEQLAVALGVTRRYVYEIESGRPNLYATRLFEALRELGAHLEVVSSGPDRPVADPDDDSSRGPTT